MVDRLNLGVTHRPRQESKVRYESGISTTGTPLDGRFEPLVERLGRALLRGLEIRQKHPLQAIAKRSTDAQHCHQVVAPRTYHKLTLIGGTGNLVQVAANAAELCQGALEGQQFLLGKWRQ